MNKGARDYPTKDAHGGRPSNVYFWQLLTTSLHLSVQQLWDRPHKLTSPLLAFLGNRPFIIVIFFWLAQDEFATDGDLRVI